MATSRIRTLIVPCLLWMTLAAATPGPPLIDYQLRHVPGRDGEETTWQVSVRVSQLPEDTHLRFELQDFGGWTALDPPYVKSVEAEPGPVTRRGANVFEVGSKDGHEVELRYVLRVPALGSEAQRAAGLLPTSWGESAYGFAWNTLVEVYEGDRLLPAGARRLELETERGGTLVSGWAGSSRGTQRVELEAPMGNASIAFGEPVARSVWRSPRHRVEVFQYSPTRDVTPRVLAVLREVWPLLDGMFPTNRSRQTLRAFVTHTQGGGMATHTGLRIGLSASDPDGIEDTPFYAQMITHELLHSWLGIRLREADPSLVWFKEGFTEYLALWTVASAGLIPLEEFARRLQEYDEIARGLPSFGTVAFGDPSVVWRDGDGPNEQLAYVGGALLAFTLDVELRASGQRGLPQLLRDLLDAGDEPYTLDDLRAWMAEHGLAERYEASIVGTELPAVLGLLERAGYETVRDGDGAAFVTVRPGDVRPFFRRFP